MKSRFKYNLNETIAKFYYTRTAVQKAPRNLANLAAFNFMFYTRGKSFNSGHRGRRGRENRQPLNQPRNSPKIDASLAPSLSLLLYTYIHAHVYTLPHLLQTHSLSSLRLFFHVYKRHVSFHCAIYILAQRKILHTRAHLRVFRLGRGSRVHAYIYTIWKFM